MHKDEENKPGGVNEVEDDGNGMLWTTLLFFFSACCWFFFSILSSFLASSFPRSWFSTFLFSLCFSSVSYFSSPFLSIGFFHFDHLGSNCFFFLLHSLLCYVFFFQFFSRFPLAPMFSVFFFLQLPLSSCLVPPLAFKARRCMHFP
jgi:hypothetical protein